MRSARQLLGTCWPNRHISGGEQRISTVHGGNAQGRGGADPDGRAGRDSDQVNGDRTHRDRHAVAGDQPGCQDGGQRRKELDLRPAPDCCRIGAQATTSAERAKTVVMPGRFAGVRLVGNRLSVSNRLVRPGREC